MHGYFKANATKGIRTNTVNLHGMLDLCVCVSIPNWKKDGLPKVYSRMWDFMVDFFDQVDADGW